MEILKPYLVFLIPIFVGFITQTIKFILFSFKHGWNIRYAFTHGHMPSAHTAFSISLVTSIGYFEGIHTGSFAIAMAVAFLIIDDAARLRMHLGDQGRYLNMLVQQLVQQMDIKEEQFPRLKERTGHRVSEIIVGALLGFILTFALIYFLG